jgi:hypothetical protein
MDPAARNLMESRLGYDFRYVRIHTNARAAQSARAVRSVAYTVGPNVVFDTGRYSPETAAGRGLLAHELAHVVQAASVAPVTGRSALKIGRTNDSSERAAEAVARSLAAAAEPLERPGGLAHAVAPPRLRPLARLHIDAAFLRRQPAPGAVQSGQQEEDPEAVKPADAGDAAAAKVDGQADAGLPAAPAVPESGDAGQAVGPEPAPVPPTTTVPVTTVPPVTVPSGPSPVAPGLAACPEPPSRNWIVLGCTAPVAKVPPPHEQANIPVIPTANFGGDADRRTFAAGLAQCRAEREVQKEIEKRFQTQVAAAKKKATGEAAADTKAAVEAATQGIAPNDRAAIRKATADATKAAKAAAVKKIADAQRAVARQPVAAVTAELARTHLDALESDYTATMESVLKAYGGGWLKSMQKVLDGKRASITKAKTAKPKVKKGETPPPAKPASEIDAEIETEMTQVRCDQHEWAMNQAEGFAYAWAVSRREQVDFETVPQKAAWLPASFGPSYAPAEADKVPVPASVRSEAGMPPVAPETAVFLTELERVLAAASPPQTYTAANYSPHGLGSWKEKGFSVDLRLPAARLDSRGFYDRSAAISFLLNLSKAASSLGAHWRVLYNDFSVAQAVNAATGSRNVVFTGNVDAKGGLNWHGPAPLILHFHLDLEIPQGAVAPAAGSAGAP